MIVILDVPELMKKADERAHQLFSFFCVCRFQSLNSGTEYPSLAEIVLFAERP